MVIPRPDQDTQLHTWVFLIYLIPRYPPPCLALHRLAASTLLEGVSSIQEKLADAISHYRRKIMRHMALDTSRINRLSHPPAASKKRRNGKFVRVLYANRSVGK